MHVILSVVLTNLMMMVMMSPLSRSSPCHCEDPADILSLKSENMDEMVFTWLRDSGITNMTRPQDGDYSVVIQQLAGTPLLGTEDCPNHRSHHPTGTKNYHRATCPWYYVLDIDDDRLPRVMVHAQCSCKKCQMHAGKHSGSCMPINHVRHVRRRVRCKEDGFYEYRDFDEHVPVGCSCVRAAIQPLHSQIHSSY